MVRVRFAPSPTGNLHIGTLRTALFNWAFARHEGGVFVLRIEDTDGARSSDVFEANIMAGLQWLGLTPDEGPDIGGDYGPYRQSERGERYQSVVSHLVSSGAAYRCYCTPEALAQDRLAQAGKPYRYSRRCLGLSDRDRAQFEREGRPFTIRFRMPNRAMIVRDIIRSDITFDLSDISDGIIMRSDGSPAFNLACAIDDIDMKITHVIRGEDHISNTPTQLAIMDALGVSGPVYAHMPMILGSDRTKLSKRHGATAVTEFQHQGYLGEAMCNYLALLGWTPVSQSEILSLETIVSEFDLKKIHKAGAIFDEKKLRWTNEAWIKTLTPAAYCEWIRGFVGPIEWVTQMSADKVNEMLLAIRSQVDLGSDVTGLIASFDPDFERYQARITSIINPEIQAAVSLFYAQFEIDSVADIERALAESLAIKGGKKGVLYQLVRVGLTGISHGPGLAAILSILGKLVIEKRCQWVAEFTQ